MAKARVVLLVALGLAVGGCSAITETWDGWFGEAPPPSPTPAAADQRPEVFYAAVDGLAMHDLPSATSQVVARLTLHQRVTRKGLARGYANVTTDAGLEGWVDNAQLLWRLPAAPAATAAPVESGAPSGGATEVPAAETAAPDATAAPAVEEAVDTPIPTAASEPPPTSTPAAQPTKAGAEPAIFDPF